MSAQIWSFPFARGAEEPAIPRINYAGQEVAIHDWMILGPFDAQGLDPLATDFLHLLGLKEAGVSREEWAALLSRRHDMPRSSLVGQVYAGVVRRQPEVNFREIYQSFSDATPQAAAYAACEIVCDANQSAMLVTESDDGLKIWLNGEFLYTSPAAQRRYQAFDDAVPLRLHRGLNFLLIKVGNFLGPPPHWVMSARLLPSKEAVIRGAWANSITLLKKLIVAQGESLELEVPGALSDQVFEVHVERFDGSPVATLLPGKTEISLPAGIYQAWAPAAGTTLRETFCVGDIDQLLARSSERVAQVTADDQTRINLETLLRRWRFCLTPESRKDADRRWERRVAFVAGELEDALTRLERNAEPFRDVPGLHLRGFRSRIDDQVQHYMEYIPSQYRRDGEKLPIAVIMTSVFSTPLPYIEGIHMRQQVEFDTLGRIAERLGLGLVWSGYRCSPYGYPCDLTHLDEVLAAVARDCNVDPQRIYLMGFCSSGINAALAAIRTPDRFAALTFLNPVLHRVKNRYDDNGEFAQQPAYQLWLRETDPVERLAQLRGTPMWIIHDGVDPGHGPLAHSVDLVEQARANGWTPRFDRVLAPSFVRTTVWEQQLAWLAQQVKKTSGHPAPPVANSSVGPVCRAFAERFVVVEATGGGNDDREACRRISQSFREAWRRTQFGDCRVIADSALTAEEERISNLVLIGNAETNKAWGRLAAKLPTHLKVDSIDIGGRTFQGKNLAIQGVAVHPDYPDRRIVFIGSANPETAVFGTQELAIDGWFDYAIWQNVGGKAELIAAERYAP